MIFKAHLLYVEDDESLSFVTRDNLEANGYELTYCEDGQKAMEAIRDRNQKYDLCIFDVMLPYVDGFTLAQEMRKYDPDVPIIFLTAKSLKEDKIHGLKIGGDDYITKPFSIEEIILKIDMFIRRSKQTVPATPVLQRVGNYDFDHPNLLLTFEGSKEERKLTQKEADLLNMFLQHRNTVIKRSHILESLWGEDDYFLGRSLDVFISRLRKYLCEDERIKIENIHSVGFRMKVE